MLIVRFGIRKLTIKVMTSLSKGVRQICNKFNNQEQHQMQIVKTTLTGKTITVDVRPSAKV